MAFDMILQDNQTLEQAVNAGISNPKLVEHIAPIYIERALLRIAEAIEGLTVDVAVGELELEPEVQADADPHEGDQ